MTGKDRGIFLCREFPDFGEGQFPVVIMLHGFTGNDIESKFYFSRLSKVLAAEGIASIRFDFRGTGNSNGSFEEMTVESEIADAVEVFEHTLNDKRYDPGKIGVLGFSMGGMVAMSMLKSMRDRIKCCMLWSPASDAQQLHKKILEDSRPIPGEAHCLDINGFKISFDFLDSLKEIDPRDGVREFKKPVFIIHGSEDRSVDCNLSLKLDEEYENVELCVIEGADHVYSSVIWGEELLGKTAGFLRTKLVFSA